MQNKLSRKSREQVLFASEVEFFVRKIAGFAFDKARTVV